VAAQSRAGDRARFRVRSVRRSERVNRAAYDLTVQAYSGYLAQNGTPDQPMAACPYVGDYFTSLMVVGSALAALQKARGTGRGESVDVAMYEVLLRIGSYYMVDYLNGVPAYPGGGAPPEPVRHRRVQV